MRIAIYDTIDELNGNAVIDVQGTKYHTGKSYAFLIPYYKIMVDKKIEQNHNVQILGRVNVLRLRSLLNKSKKASFPEGTVIIQG